MPFPTAQGTQASIRAMLDVLAGVGRDAHLLAYARSAFEIEAGFTMHRAPGLPGRDAFRSGPSIRKVVEDVALARSLRRLARALAPAAIVAHHVEAGAACIAARMRRWVFVAHTDLARELPTYAPAALEAPLAAIGARTEHALARRASAVCAIAPALASTLETGLGREIRYLPVPWPLAPERTRDERASARDALSLEPGADVLLYAGNLDAYQGWQDVVRALVVVRSRRPRARLVVATASDPAPLHAEARAAGVHQHVRVTDLDTERARRRVHAAADVALVSRRTPGGLPIKLLDALARGLPTVVASRAAAGLDFRGAAIVVADDDPDALAQGALTVLAAGTASAELAIRARAYIATDHAPERFVAEYESVITQTYI